jgi:hypothetical protein
VVEVDNEASSCWEIACAKPGRRKHDPKYLPFGFCKSVDARATTLLEVFSTINNIQLESEVLGPTQPPSQWVTEALSTGGKADVSTS